MFLLYLDESGTPEVPGTSSFFVLCGISVPIWHWRDCERDIYAIRREYDLEDCEIHTAWMLRPYLEQSKIPRFETLSWAKRRSESHRARNAHLLELQKSGRSKALRQAKKNYRKSEAYIHLTFEQRLEFVRRVADAVADWGFARLFAECIDKLYFDPLRTGRTISQQAFEQVVSRFERYLQATDNVNGRQNYGLLVHDNNETVAKQHTLLMKEFHRTGTLWVNIERTIETPMFVNSELTSMVQIADLCSYAIRRYLENGEEDLFDRIFARADRYRNKVVGVRHYGRNDCVCKICRSR